MSLFFSGLVTQRIIAAPRLVDHVASYMAAAAGIPGKTKPMFSSEGGIVGPYTRNANTWLPGVDWSSMPVRIDYNGSVSKLARGCLVTPRHLLAVNHAGVAPGNTVYFLGTDDQLYSRTVTAVNASLSAEDLRVALLSSDLPSVVTPAKLLPANVENWIDTADHDDLENTGFSIVMIDQDLNIVSKRWTGYNPASLNQATYPNETIAPMSAYTESIVGNDSASPVYIIINGVPVIISLVSSIAQSGPAFNKLRIGLDAAVVALGGGHALQSVDLMGFSA